MVDGGVGSHPVVCILDGGSGGRDCTASHAVRMFGSVPFSQVKVY